MKEVILNEEGAIVNLSKGERGPKLVKFKLFKNNEPFNVNDEIFNEKRMKIWLKYDSGIGYMLKKGEADNELLMSVSLDLTKNVGTYKAEAQLISSDSEKVEVFDRIKFIVKENEDELSDNASN